MNKNVYGHLYRHHDGNICYYCGELAQHEDHCPPLTRIIDYRSLYEGQEYLKVPACSECNTLLSNTLQRNLTERKKHLKHLLRKRYKRVARYVIRSEEELQEFTGDLKTIIENIPNEKARLNARLEH